MDEQLKVRMEPCQINLKSLAEHVGAEEAVFFFDFIEPENWLGKHWLSGIKQRNSLIYSSSQIKYLVSRQRSCLTKMNPDILKSAQKPIHIWKDKNSANQQSLRENLLQGKGYSSTISVSFPLAKSHYLRGCFNFFYHRENSESDIHRIKDLQGAMFDMQMLSGFAVSEKMLASPFEDYKIFKPSTLSIIRHVAEGYSRKEISDIHYMSERGIDYHIDKVRLVLGAKNTLQLVHIAHNMMLV